MSRQIANVKDFLKNLANCPETRAQQENKMYLVHLFYQAVIGEQPLHRDVAQVRPSRQVSFPPRRRVGASEVRYGPRHEKAKEEANSQLVDLSVLDIYMNAA
jgi:hypothetical protein